MSATVEDTPAFRVCHECPVPHVENCPDCFGWGRYRDGAGGPMPASTALRDDPPPWARCTTCGGSPGGRKMTSKTQPTVEDSDLELVRPLVEEATDLHLEQQRRRARPIEDAAELDPEDPDYFEKLQALVEEVAGNLVEDG